MESETFGAGLRYVDAEDFHLTDAGLLIGAEVRDRQNAKVGELDGFVVEAATGQPRYAVVDAGGWFKSDRYLLPIGHIEKSTEGTLHVNIEKAAIRNYPQFDEATWLTASPEQRWEYEYQMLAACCPEDASRMNAGEKEFAYDRWQHYRQPAWWRSRDSELDLAVGEATPRRDPSPHVEGRAQPGDVIGIETEGERSYIGDTAETENKRREDAERSAARLRGESDQKRRRP